MAPSPNHTPGETVVRPALLSAVLAGCGVLAAAGPPPADPAPFPEAARLKLVEQIKAAVGKRDKDPAYLKQLAEAKALLARCKAGVVNRGLKAEFVPPVRSLPIQFPSPKHKADAVADGEKALADLVESATGPVADITPFAPPLPAKPKPGDAGRFYDGTGFLLAVRNKREIAVTAPGPDGPTYEVHPAEDVRSRDGVTIRVSGVYYVTGRTGPRSGLPVLEAVPFTINEMDEMMNPPRKDEKK
jgi:hypothetical protein